AHAVPAQLHVVVQAAADDVHVVVDEAGNDAATGQVDALRLGAGERHDLAVAADGDKAPVLHGRGLGLRLLPVERRDLAVEEDEIGICGHGVCLSISEGGAGTGGSSAGASLPDVPRITWSPRPA